WFVRAVAGLTVAGILALAVALTLVPAVVGGHTATVLSGSMAPRLPVGSVLVDKPVKAGSLETGDIITYVSENSLVTHRIVRIRHTEDGPAFITQGDANDTPDREPVQPAQIRGELWYHVPYIGTVRDALTSPSGLVMAGSGVVLLTAVRFLVRLHRSSPISDNGDKP